MRGLPCRVLRLERRVLPVQWGIVPIVDPDRWLEDVRAAYAAAGARGDQDALTAIVEARTGERPSPDRTGCRG